ncbi:hypothetical protein KUCAC02_007489 [Chaenocephalus aceratus]|uniref:Uncharacterized protein n=1 Tax=Chaenocephalus aceratus TaxID=36190 RepID=A0ACB9X5Q2_CHAAC|nr:hypothetical protein KUCAC02_007489 [Chaenocephalus aceratus]
MLAYGLPSWLTCTSANISTWLPGLWKPPWGVPIRLDSLNPAGREPARASIGVPATPPICPEEDVGPLCIEDLNGATC